MIPRPASPAARKPRAFTLIELLIVVAIIAILAAIAVPNFLEAQVRSKVSRVKADMRSLATALESYAVDNNEYPEGTDETDEMPQQVVDTLGAALASRFYTFRTRGPNNDIAGLTFATLTTPIAYITSIMSDPFAGTGHTPVPFSYRNAKVTKDGYIMTSVGPDADLLATNGNGIGNSRGSNPISTAADDEAPAHVADINERMVIHFMEGDIPPSFGVTPEQHGLMDVYLDDLSYDPTNGTTSDGDIYRKSGVAK